MAGSFAECPTAGLRSLGIDPDDAEAALRNHRALKGQHLPSGPRGGRRRHRIRRRVVSDPATSAAANMDTNTSDGESDELDAFIAAKEADELDAFLAVDVAAASAAQRRRPSEPEEALLAQLIADRALSVLVDEFYFEHHVLNTPMWHYGWKGGTVTNHTIVHSYELFSQLRELGIRAHSWV